MIGMIPMIVTKIEDNDNDCTGGADDNSCDR